MSDDHTQLKDRTLYYDGDSVVTPECVADLIDKGVSLESFFVTEETDEIRQYNGLTSSQNTLHTKNNVRPLTFEWNIPESYKTLNVEEYIDDKFDEEVACNFFGGKIDGAAVKERVKRVNDELELFKDLQLYPVLRTIIYVINTLQDKNIVWGVGRGSSVSSYVLYLIGAHDVDSVKYELDFTDFLRRPSHE